jgi:ABC-type branched-subunit amino acid transport system substrate-binding protein
MLFANQINFKLMNLKFKTLTIIILLAFFAKSNLTGQNEQQKYGNTSEDVMAFSKYAKAYKYHFLTPLQFYGAGREKKAPNDLKEVRIGFLGPLSNSIMVPQGKQMLNGANLAIDEANEKGGYKGRPYKLMVHNDVGLWGAAANEVVKMDDEGVWAWLGSIDDIVSHVALRATLKLEIFMVCTGDPDPTFTETNIPWQIRVITDDRRASYQLVNKIYKTDKHTRVSIIRANNRYGRVGTKHFVESATRLGHPPVIEERFKDGETDFKTQLERIMTTSPDAILVWGNAKESGLILKQMRAMGFKQPVYGSDRMVNPEFLKIAGPDAEGVVTTCQYNPNSTDPKYLAFKKKYLAKYGLEPDVFAAHAYDGMQIIIKSIENVGLNRVLIRDWLTNLNSLKGYKGVTGKVVLDASWNNVRDLWMVNIKNGKFEITPAPPLDPKLKSSSKTGDY